MIPTPFSLIQKPTPCHRLDRASEALGVDLWIKRDDLTGFAMGGNKGRKLEFLVADALAAGADTIVTCGAAQSNFIRQLGAACAVAGLRCHAVMMPLPFEAGHEVAPPNLAGRGNLVLNDLFGVEPEMLDNGTWDQLFEAWDAAVARLRNAGRSVYPVALGGSGALGAYAFFEAANELPSCERVITASSSGSTHMGLHVAFRDYPTRVTGIACDPEPDFLRELIGVGNALCELLDTRPLDPDEVDLRRDYVGPGYGIPSEAGEHALEWLARTEGILLDPVYSAKAFAGVLDLAQRGELEGETVVFWHTGGTPALFAYR
jgi:1-aminocyclopropane-1-carboxylate deaminase/D-cysteine desulfhydrase-like pyridoxal-dependent ACC family enzyme